MAVDLTPKLRNIASDSTTQSKSLLQAIGALVHDAEILLQSGGNFPDDLFDNTNLSYLTAYQANVFMQVVVPALDAFLDTHLQGDAQQITYRQSLQCMVSGTY